VRRATVGRLGRLRPDGFYEAALVLSPARSLDAFVRRARRGLPVARPRERPLPPHVTVLFLGRAPGRRLARWLRALEGLAPAPLRLRLDGVGVFRAGGRVVNLHLRLAPEAPLRALHAQALERVLAAGWAPATPYLRERYVPHLSLLDGIDADDALGEHPLVARLPRLEALLGDLHVIGKRLGRRASGGAV
jgi:2'-5' RNA ligase